MVTPPTLYVVSFKDFDLPPRYDGVQWTQIRIDEGTSDTGPWNQIDLLAIDPTMDPANPEPLSFTTEKATLPAGQGWYQIFFIDANGTLEPTEPVFNAGPIEILASLDDINSYLDGKVIEADAQNTQYVQVSVNRVIKGFLARNFDPVTLCSWASPEVTPDVIREIAAMLIASQVYFDAAARSSLDLAPTNFSQILYERAMALLNEVLVGEVPLYVPGCGDPNAVPPVPPVQIVPINPEEMETVDYFPIDATDRAFTMSQKF